MAHSLRFSLRRRERRKIAALYVMLKVESILCPTDLTASSDEALRYAIALSIAYEAKLFLCHCVENKPSNALEKEKKRDMDAAFFEAIWGHIGRHDACELKWQGLIIEECRSPAQGIIETAANLGVDLIVMRSRRRPHIAALLGSTAEAVCRTAPCPVLVTHPQEREWVSMSTSDIDLQRVLVAYDFSDDSERALNFALSIAQEFQSELHLLHVLQRSSDDSYEIDWNPSEADSHYHNAIRRIKTVVPPEVYLWCKVKHSVKWGKPYSETLAYAKDNQIDLICMGASGSSYMLGALFGSNVDRVLRQSPCPILIARLLKPAIKVVGTSQRA